MVTHRADLYIVPRHRKRQKVTANAIVKALSKDNHKKYYLQHGDGYLKAAAGCQNIGILGHIGADLYRTDDEKLDTVTVADTRGRRFTNPKSYTESFAFDKIVYPGTSATAVTYGGMPEGTYAYVRKTETTFFINNSSSSTTYAYLYELCPRRQLTDGPSKGIAEALFNATGTTDDYTYWSSVGENEANKQYHLAGNLFQNELGPLTIGVTPYDNKQLTQDYKINYMGCKVLEPGQNSRFKVKRGRYKYEYNASTGELLYYDRDHFRSYLLRIHGEPVSAVIDTDADGVMDTTEVAIAQWSPCKIQWTWINKMYWDLPPTLTFGQQVTGTDIVTGTSQVYLGPTAVTAMKQILATAPTDGTVPGVTPTVV